MSNHNGNANKMVGEDHIRDATKMVGDTPRTEAEVNRQKCWSDDLITIDANFACQLERELNATNESFRKLNIHALDLVDLIKRLEDAGDALCENSNPTKWDSLQAANRKLDAQEAWRKAKEAKP